MELIVLENEVKVFPNQKEPNQKEKEPNQKEKEPNQKGSNPLFLNRYQPKYFNDFETDPEMIDILNTLISINNLNVLFIGDIGCGKTAFLNASIREYYKGIPETKFNDNILHINSLKEQGIKYSAKRVPLLSAKRKSLFWMILT